MSIEQLLDEEAEASETNMDAPLRVGTTITRGNQKSKVYSLRLTESEYASLEEVAKRVGMAPSALARSWIVEKLAAEDAESTDFQLMASALEAFSKRLAAV